MSSGGPAGPGVLRDLERLVDRVARLPVTRLSAGGNGSPARVCHRLAAELADATARLEGAPPHQLPWLDELAVADQLAVTAADLGLALRRAGGVETDALLEVLRPRVREVRDSLG